MSLTYTDRYVKGQEQREWRKDNVLKNNDWEISRIDERLFFIILDSQKWCK